MFMHKRDDERGAEDERVFYQVRYRGATWNQKTAFAGMDQAWIRRAAQAVTGERVRKPVFTAGPIPHRAVQAHADVWVQQGQGAGNYDGKQI